MSHCDPDDLALRSLGETFVSPEDETHLTTCNECQATVDGLGAVVIKARAGGGIGLLTPSPGVWARIITELDLSARPSGQTGRPPVEPSVQPQAGPPEVEASTREATVTSLSERRARRIRPSGLLLAAAGIGGVVVGGVATAVVLGDSTQQSATVAASTELAPLPDWDTDGTAEVTVDADGRQVLQVSVSQAASSASGYQEVWLIDTDVEGMVSLGILDGTSGSFVVPEGVDVAAFPIVDVSLEPLDGDPTHSGNSITRGQIDV